MIRRYMTDGVISFQTKYSFILALILFDWTSILILAKMEYFFLKSPRFVHVAIIKRRVYFHIVNCPFFCVLSFEYAAKIEGLNGWCINADISATRRSLVVFDVLSKAKS
mmetsp:Transcript_13807/g.27963  ORF Transcript_13807/g.27963 Transcript_13807/m.27963 type:complete len:109 (-) Transcript_13807:2145-2471(-)